MKSKIDYSLYLCTDRSIMSDTSIEECVEKSLKGGVSVVQIREKDCPGKEFLQIAKSVKEITKRYNVPLIINDRVDVAIAVGADGVHVGQDDLPCAIVRSMVGEDMIIGVSASSLTEALKAQQDGADYIGVGAMFATDTKTDAKVVSMEELDRIRREVSIPIVVIGGINKTTLPDFIGKGIDGIAVVSAIVSQNDVESAARELKSMFHIYNLKRRRASQARRLLYFIYRSMRFTFSRAVAVFSVQHFYAYLFTFQLFGTYIVDFLFQRSERAQKQCEITDCLHKVEDYASYIDN